MGRLYDIHIKPKMETMKTEIKNMEIHIDAQRREIESLKNRKIASLLELVLLCQY